MDPSEKKFQRVYRWLLVYIEENKFSGNQKLPSENALCRKLQVSRETIRRAIDVLVQEGVVYKLKGSGTYFRREKVMSQELNTGKAPLKIGLVLQGQDTSANSGLIDGIRSVLEPDRVDLHVFLTDNKFYYERRCLETVAHQNFQGFIVDGVKASILSPNLDCYKELYRRKIPVIFYNNFYKNLRCPRVIINDRDYARQLLARLIDAGHKNIAGIFFYDNYASVEKFQGMAEAMQERGLEMKDHYIKWCISDEARQHSYVCPSAPPLSAAITLSTATSATPWTEWESRSRRTTPWSALTTRRIPTARRVSPALWSRASKWAVRWPSGSCR